MSADLEIMFSRLLERMESLESENNDLRRRMNDMFREGKILEQHEDGTYTAQFYGDESKTKKIPHPQQAGAISDWVPYSPGQRVLMINPTGEAGRGFIIPAGYTDDFPQPHNAPGEAMRKVGASSDLTTGSKRVIISADIELHGNIRMFGGTVEHNGVYIGEDHLHTGVIPGGGLTGPPVGS